MSTPTLSDILSRKLEQKRENHPSFKLMKIDDRLFPNAQTMNSTLVLEARDSNNEPKTVREIVAESWEKGSKNHLMIEGEGGIGKTVTLLSIPNKFTPFPVPAIYIPLHELPKGDDPIEGYIRKKILNGKAALFEQLLDLIDQTWDKGPHLLLLLDGFNEIAAENRQIISEDIGHWSEYPGIQIVTSSRYDIHTYVALSYDYSTIKLQPLSDTAVEDYLKSMDVRVPTDSAVKELITIPLLLTLYVKTELILEQRETDSAEFREAKNAGSIVWNYLQCELWHFGKENQDAKNAIIAMEFISPYMAWQMQRSSLFDLNKKDFHKFLGNAYTLLESHFNNSDNFPFHIQDALQKSDGIPPLETIRNLLEKHLCLFVKNGNSYKLMHQQFRDALAAMHLINSIYLNGNSRPTEWNPIVDHYVMQFVADLIGEEEANCSWEQNRTSPQLESATRNQLELQRRLHKCDFSKLDFSAIDLSEISLYPYRINNTSIKLPNNADKMAKTILSEKTFSAEGHSASVYAVTITPDGKHIISGSWDHTIRVWDLETKAPIGKPLEGHTSSVFALAVTPDGKHIVSGSGDHTIRVWDLESGAPIGKPLEGHSSSVVAVAVTPDGKHIVSGSWDYTIRVWDLETGSQIGMSMKGHANAVGAVVVTPDGKHIVSGSGDNTIRVWDLETDTQIGKTIVGHSSSVFAVAVTPDGKRIVSGAKDNTICIWDLKTGSQIGTPMKGHTDAVTTLVVTPDGKHIVSGSGDNTIRVWDLEMEKSIGLMKGHTAPIYSVAVTPDGKRIVSGSSDNAIQVWDLETGSQIGEPIKGRTASVSALALTSDGRHIVIGLEDNTIRIWDSGTGVTMGMPMDGHTDSVTTVAVTQDDKCIVSGSLDNTIRIWDLETGNPVGEAINGHTAPVADVTVTPDNNHIVSGSWDNTIRVWNLNTGDPVGLIMKGHSSYVEAVAVTPDGKHIVSGSWDNTIRVWDWGTWTPMEKPIEGHSSSVYAIAVTPSSNHIVSGSWDNTIRVWDLETGISVGKVIDGHTDYVYTVALTLDGKCIVSGSKDNTIRVWDLDTRAPVGSTMKGHTASVCAVAVTPDGKHIVSGSYDCTVRIWDLDSGECITTIRIHPLSFVGLDFSKAIISTPELKEQLRQNGAKV